MGDENVPESIETDGTLVWRILMNYVTNALKAAVRPGAEQGRGVDVRISRVQANATGISPAQDCATLLCRAGAIAAAKRGAVANEEVATDVVGLAPTARPDEWLKIVVEDSGPGADATLRHRLFNAFVQAQGAKEGTGLGLFAVKQCASLLSGASSSNFGWNMPVLARLAGCSLFLNRAPHAPDNREAHCLTANKPSPVPSFAPWACTKALKRRWRKD